MLKTEERSQQPVRVQALVLVMVPECTQLMEIITLTGHGKLKSLYVYWSLQNSKYCAVLLGKEFFCLVVFLQTSFIPFILTASRTKQKIKTQNKLPVQVRFCQLGSFQSLFCVIFCKDERLCLSWRVFAIWLPN